MELMEQTDMLIVAGGDGTLQEVITGLLRRPDQVGVTLLFCWSVIRVWFIMHLQNIGGQLNPNFSFSNVTDRCFMVTGYTQ